MKKSPHIWKGKQIYEVILHKTLKNRKIKATQVM